MKILIIGAGVLGCNMAHNFYRAGKDITLLARGKWGETIKEKGLIIKDNVSKNIVFIGNNVDAEGYAAFACYYTDGNLKKIKNNKIFIYKIIDANAECYSAVEALGHELLPKGEEEYHSTKYRKMCYRFYKLMCATAFGKLCASDHAMSAVNEMNILASELEKMIVKAGIKAENYFELKQYIMKYL